MDNISRISEFTLSGLNETMDLRLFIFSLTLLCYCVIVLVNVTLIVTIILDENLHDPMYILLCNLCINGLYGTAGFYPKFMFDLLSNVYVISYEGCMLQICVIYSSVCNEYSILAVMAYDRYVAICKPLQYHSIMTKPNISILLCFSWFSTIVIIFIGTCLTSTLRLCGSHVPKLYCDNWSVVKLSCSLTTTPNNVFGYMVLLIYLGHGLFIVWSYIDMVRSCLKSIEDRGKFMQTCMPHLLSLVNVTVAMLFDVMYTKYGSIDLTKSVKNFLAIEFLIVPPIFNPLIYGVNLSKVRNRLFHCCTHRQRRTIKQ